MRPVKQITQRSDMAKLTGALLDLLWLRLGWVGVYSFREDFAPPYIEAIDQLVGV